MKKFIAKIWYKAFGWTFNSNDEKKEKSKHCVMIAAPHTSNWDFPFTILGFWLEGLDLKFFIKDNYTKPFLIGSIFRWLGALGVNRSKRNNLVEHSVALLKSNKNLVILVPAEGTRSRVNKWRKGFYQIAVQAQVPISLGYLDFKKKEAGLGPILYPTGDFEKDMQVIEDFYRNIEGKNPENYNPKIF